MLFAIGIFEPSFIKSLSTLCLGSAWAPPSTNTHNIPGLSTAAWRQPYHWEQQLSCLITLIYPSSPVDCHIPRFHCLTSCCLTVKVLDNDQLACFYVFFNKGEGEGLRCMFQWLVIPADEKTSERWYHMSIWTDPNFLYQYNLSWVQDAFPVLSLSILTIIHWCCPLRPIN